MRKNENRDNLEVRPVSITKLSLKEVDSAIEYQLGLTKVTILVNETANIGELEVDVNRWLSVQSNVKNELILSSLKTALAETLKDTGFYLQVQIMQADGDIIAAVINASYVAIQNLLLKGNGQKLKPFSAINVGFIHDELFADLTSKEEEIADSHLLIVQNESGAFLQLNFEKSNADLLGDKLTQLLGGAMSGLSELMGNSQKQTILIQNEHIENQKDVILIATKNEGKATEFKRFFNPLGFKVTTLLDYPELPDVEETGKTFEENARLKAETISQLTQLPVLADDSGLMVDALDGRPGIFSARFAEDHNDAANNAKLLHEMTDVPKEKRTANFHTTLVFAKPGHESLVVDGEVAGEILGIPRGDNGFGYDSLFYVPELDKSMAELTEVEKNKISHRGRATVKLMSNFNDWWEK
ncbi:XTP/dITP diphosphatase [Dellaglioa sp. P0083]|uniref:XTP/dITP diphosphatase n=1 Tax=Dellaglioa kimchii TaxID=3344667 RepID=UPI0038D44B51